MSEPIREQVSALLDGELAESEMSLLVRRLERDAELRGAFGRYVLIGETLRAPAGPIAGRDFATRVAAGIDDAPLVAAEPEPPARRAYGSRGTALAAAAAGAAVAVIALWQPLSENTEPLAAITPVATHISIGPGDYLVSESSPESSMDEQMTRYMIAHSQFAAPMARRSVLSSVVADDPAIAPESLPGNDFEAPAWSPQAPSASPDRTEAR